MATKSESTESIIQSNKTGYSDGDKIDTSSIDDNVDDGKKPDDNPLDDMYSHTEDKTPEEIKAESDKKIEDDAKAEADKLAAEEIKDKATGYEDKTPEEIKADEDAAKKLEEKTPEQIKADEDAAKLAKEEGEITKEEVDKLLGELGEDYDIEGVSKLAIDSKFSKEQIEAYVAFAKQQDQQNVASYEESQIKQKNDYIKELKDDKDFSGQNGENFLKSVNKVERILEDLMPNTKNKLTQGEKMLPPYIMKDILNISRTINPKSKLVSGDASIPVTKDKGNFLDEMYE